MKINIETLVEIIVKEVIAELSKAGFALGIGHKKENISFRKVEKKKQEIDMSGYKTPILTEGILESLSPGIDEIIIPQKTVFTPGAREYIKKKNFIITYN